MTKISWIHISDQHFTSIEDHKKLQQRLLADLIHDINTQREKHQINPFFLFATGDLVYGSRLKNTDDARTEVEQQFECACTWITELQKGINAKACLTVPGNHDVFWPETPKSLLKALTSLVNPEDCSQELKDLKSKDLVDLFVSTFEDPNRYAERESLMSQLEIFARKTRKHNIFPPQKIGLSWHKHLSGNTNSDLSYKCHTEIDGVQVEIIGINTAWTSTEPTKHLASFPTAANHQMARLATPPNDDRVTIILMHHPIGWMWIAERPDMRERVQKQADFLLRGHEHVNWINPFGVATVELSPPATAGVSPHLPNGYLLCEYNTETKMTRIIARETSLQDGEFKFDSIPHEFADNNQIRLVPISREDARGNASSNAASRRIGYRAGNLKPIAREGDRGAVLTLDIANFSQLTQVEQIHALDTVWNLLSTKLDSGFKSNVFNNIVVGIASLSDGFQIGIKGSDPEKSACELLSVFRRIQAEVVSEGRIINLRAGACIGDFEIISTGSRMPCIISGNAANLSRRLAYNTSNRSIAIPKVQWDNISHIADIHEQWNKYMIGQGEQNLYLTHASSAPPVTYVAFSALRQDVGPSGVLKRAVHAQRQLHSVLNNVLSSIQSDNSLTVDAKAQLFSCCHFEIDSVWLGRGNAHFQSPAFCIGILPDSISSGEVTCQTTLKTGSEQPKPSDLYLYNDPPKYARTIAGRRDCQGLAFSKRGFAIFQDGGVKYRKWCSDNYEGEAYHDSQTSPLTGNRECILACSPSFDLRVGVSSCIISLYADAQMDSQTRSLLASAVHHQITAHGDVQSTLPKESFVAAWASLQFTTV